VFLQWPLSSASDQLDRRFVGAVAASGAIGASAFLLAAGPEGRQGLLAMTLIGGMTLPLYSIAAAYTNDWVEPEHVSAAAASLHPGERRVDEPPPERQGTPGDQGTALSVVLPRVWPRGGHGCLP